MIFLLMQMSLQPWFSISNESMEVKMEINTKWQTVTWNQTHSI